ncbi:hypothetical protein U9M48_025755 [Paspalum notatum var. saurae]|uniref:Uncharacterized protein n=1 Tax=Paspalum notatum var. saurae TaxID=547442 RepID=A0AAQ3WXN4_PASNO
MSGQANQPVDSSGADGQPQHQPLGGMAGLAGAETDPQFVMLRTAMLQKIFEYIRRMPLSAEWQLPLLVERLEAILYVKFPNRDDYYNMMKGPVEPQLQFAIRTFTQFQQNQQNTLVARQAPSSPSTDPLVDSSSIGLDGADGQPQHQLVEGMASLPGMDQRSEYIGRKQCSTEWQKRLPELTKRLEEILYQKYPNMNDYYNMMKGPIEPQLQFAIKTLSAQSQQNQQNQQVARQTPSSSSTDLAVERDGQFEQLASLQVEMQKLMLMSTTELDNW